MSGLLLIRIAGAVALVFGILGLLLPDTVAGFLDLELLTDFARGEVRSSYGGLWLMMGVVALGGTFSRRGRNMIRGIGLAWIGLLLGRVVSLILDGPGIAMTWLSLAVELVLVFLLLHGARLLGMEAKAQAAASG